MNVPFIVFPIFLDQWGKRMEISFKIFSGGLVLKDKKITKLEINTSFSHSLLFLDRIFKTKTLICSCLTTKSVLIQVNVIFVKVCGH